MFNIFRKKKTKETKRYKTGLMGLLGESKDCYDMLDKLVEHDLISEKRKNEARVEIEDNLGLETWIDSLILKVKAYDEDLFKRANELEAGINRISRKLRIKL